MNLTPTIQNVSAEFLGHLQQVKAIRPGQYLALCPGHDDRTPSLKITEAQDRLLVHCWAGCRACDILRAMGLDFPDLFVQENPRTTQEKVSGQRKPAPLPYFHWDWRSQLAELERLVQVARENAEAVIGSTHHLDLSELADHDFDLVMNLIGRAYGWLDRCERLDDTIFFLQQKLRAEERDRK